MALDERLHRCNSIKVYSSYVHQCFFKFFKCEHGDEAFVEIGRETGLQLIIRMDPLNIIKSLPLSLSLSLSLSTTALQL